MFIQCGQALIVWSGRKYHHLVLRRGVLHQSIAHLRYIWFNRKHGLRARMPDATVHAVPATTAATSGESDGCRHLVGEA